MSRKFCQLPRRPDFWAKNDDDDEDRTSEFKLQRKKHKVSWPNFCFRNSHNNHNVSLPHLLEATDIGRHYLLKAVPILEEAPPKWSPIQVQFVVYFK